ncbi:MAG: hypothetical protein EXR27_00015 [Betaproteobacteria bacterium]|nr:hypothetical protein [Betaproteobacteria bacterium]
MAAGHKTGGRQRGTPNRITRSFREAVQIAYDAIGGDEAFATWARENSGEFYKIAARLIPQEMRYSGSDGESLTVNIIHAGVHDSA